ncbi:uncharacterized protein LOC144704456 [Wolffia australiana]
MAATSFIAAALRRRACGIHGDARRAPIIGRIFAERSLRSLSSAPPEKEACEISEGSLRDRIFRLRLPKRSTTAVLERWVGDGGTVTASQLRRIAVELRRAQRYKHALELSEWMITHHGHELLPKDYAVRLGLISSVFGISSAEEFFENLPLKAKNCETFTALLHAYASAKLVEKAESLFEDMKEAGSPPSTLTFNEMMTLYISVGQAEKVPLVVEQLKNSGESADLFTYNLWISGLASSMDFDAVRRVLHEMSALPNADDDTKKYVKLSEIYISAVCPTNLITSLGEAEKMQKKKMITYDFLLILHASLGNKEKINEIWKSLKMTMTKNIAEETYTCALSVFVFLDNFKDAGDIVDEWMKEQGLEHVCGACERLFHAILKADLESIAEKFRQLLSEKNINVVYVPEKVYVIGDRCILLVPLLCRMPMRYKLSMSFIVQILTWMGSKGSFEIIPSDHAQTLELIAEAHGLREAEAYYARILHSNSQFLASSLALLRCYVKERRVLKAESLWLYVQRMGLSTPHPFNDMMKLYMTAGHHEKVLSIIQKMKHGMIPLDVVSYNIWINASSEINQLVHVEQVFREMVGDRTVVVGWSTYSVLANIYIKHGQKRKAFAALKDAEGRLSTRNRLGYFFLITLYAARNDLDAVKRLWEASKKVPGRITSANYMCIILCLIKLGDIAEAEKAFRKWESECRKYDIRVPNVLLGAYVRRGWMKKAESLHLHTLARGGLPNYKTWEILMEGWIAKMQMDKAGKAMARGLSLLKSCASWRPSDEARMCIMEHYEELGDVDVAWKYVESLHRLDLMNLPLYKSFLRICVRAQRSASNVIKMAQVDGVELDEEALDLGLRSGNRPRLVGIETGSSQLIAEELV